MLNIPKAADAKAAAEKRAEEILQGDYDKAKREVERELAAAIQAGKQSCDVEVPSSVAATILSELQAVGYRAKRDYQEPCGIQIAFDGKAYR